MWAVASHSNSHHHTPRAGRMAALFRFGRAAALVIGAGPGLVNFFAHLGATAKMTIVGSIVGGPLADILSPIISPIGGLVVREPTGSAAGLVLQGISSWVLDGTKGALEEVASVIGAATAPNLESTWFSSTYWRVAALAAMLTIPFLCAAAVEAVARADLSLLARVIFGYLPLSLLGVSLAAPLTMLLLAATDQMSAVVSAKARAQVARASSTTPPRPPGALASATGGSPFFAVVVGLLALMAAMALAVELLVRAAAVYVVVLMLPLAFAALVWPARRVWAVRLVELLASLILSKFVDRRGAVACGRSVYACGRRGSASCSWRCRSCCSRPSLHGR